MAGPPYSPPPLMDWSIILHSPSQSFPAGVEGVPQFELSWSHVDSAFDVWMPHLIWLDPPMHIYTHTHTHTPLPPTAPSLPGLAPLKCHTEDASWACSLDCTLKRLLIGDVGLLMFSVPGIFSFLFLRPGFQLNCICSQPNAT